MRIGVLTFHRCINYGSYWQARCLVEGLRARGHDAVLLDHASRRVDIAEWRCAFRPTLPTPTPPSDRPLYRRKIRLFFDAIRALPLLPPFPLEGPAPDSFDLVVVGSDEVWNLSHPWYGGYPLFYGQGLRASRVVAYAASFGNYDRCHGLAPEWARMLEDFDHISVRDDASRAIVEQALGTIPELVLDPCLQFPPDLGPGEPVLHGRYLALYGHGFSPALVARVRGWAWRQGMPVVSIGYRNDWADRQWLDAGPYEFARFMAGAAAVVSNFFHGCVFALRFRKPFAAEETGYRRNKLRGLMAAVDGQPHLLAYDAADGQLDALLESPLPAAITERIGCHRERSNRFLDQALAGL